MKGGDIMKNGLLHRMYVWTDNGIWAFAGVLGATLAYKCVSTVYETVLKDKLAKACLTIEDKCKKNESDDNVVDVDIT